MGLAMSEKTWQTSITKIEPNKIRIRGYAVDELMGKISFSQAIYLILKGTLPSPEVSRLMDAILVSSIDHGVTPPSTIAAITAVSTGASLNAALAAGVLSINAHHGGAVEGCMRFLQKIKQRMDEQNLDVETAVQKMITEYREEKKRIPGFGHRLHTEDPRSKALFNLADSLGLSSGYLEIARSIEKNLPEALGRALPLNVDGAIAAILSDLDIPIELANAFFIMARVPGLVAHIREEMIEQRPMRMINSKESEYVGPENLKLP